MTLENHLGTMPSSELKLPTLFYPWLTKVDIYPTWKCNYNCGHCIGGDIKRGSPAYSDPYLLKKALDSLDGLASVHFSGGEPFLHPDIFDLLQYASQRAGEVRINTSGNTVPLDYEQAKRVLRQLPSNTRLYLSIDAYHKKEDPDLRQRITMFKQLARELGLGLAFNLRTDPPYSMVNVRYDDEIRESQKLARAYGIEKEDTTIWNRILKLGNARFLPEARYIDLTKLLTKTLEDPQIGILPDGTVVSDFVAAYLPSSVRPQICTLGNLQNEGLLGILYKYQEFRKSEPNISSLLRAMIEDMKDYPFEITSTPRYFKKRLEWASKDLRDIMERAISNTKEDLTRILGKKTWALSQPRDRNYDRVMVILISDGGRIRYSVFVDGGQLDYGTAAGYYGGVLGSRSKIAEKLGRVETTKREVIDDGHPCIEYRYRAIIPDKEAIQGITETMLLAHAIKRLREHFGLNGDPFDHTVPVDELEIEIAQIVKELGDGVFITDPRDSTRGWLEIVHKRMA